MSYNCIKGEHGLWTIKIKVSDGIEIIRGVTKICDAELRKSFKSASVIYSYKKEKRQRMLGWVECICGQGEAGSGAKLPNNLPGLLWLPSSSHILLYFHLRMYFSQLYKDIKNTACKKEAMNNLKVDSQVDYMNYLYYFYY